MDKIKKILNILTIVMVVITLVIFGLFLFGGNVPNQLYTTPVYTGTLLTWCYILGVIAIILALIFPLINLFTRPKQAVKSFIGLGVIFIIILIAYALSDGTPLKIPGYNGPDNVPSRLIMTDTLIYAMYFLLGGALIAIIGTGIYRKFKSY
ncbi:MAG TPA: hypothetical protein H9863_05765 [Candidatus Odoribacter faecigallinarum]|mgnify:CR=1 FL=1|jgi:hypothetical protein|uniref:Uncharacterized protein n=1 Tax=Candidatus Odoribacter faecigallinarum TaxID=2838706 RepID=A0A9D1V004_9BACT|nr:hypothetical protein [Candidatus Odoribacter faecigallinarum]